MFGYSRTEAGGVAADLLLRDSVKDLRVAPLVEQVVNAPGQEVAMRRIAACGICRLESELPVVEGPVPPKLLHNGLATNDSEHGRKQDRV